MEYKKLDFKNDDELDLLVELQKAVYPERADAFDKSLFRFWYVDNPCGGVISFNAIDNGKIVAHQSFVPELMEVDGRVVRCARSMAVVTHPDYQGKGLFSTLTNMAVEEARQQGYEFLYAITNGNSFPRFVKHCGFSSITRLTVKIGVGTKVEEAGNKTYKRHWTPEILKWRLSKCDYFRKGNHILGNYGLGVKTLMGTLNESLLNAMQLKEKKHTFGPKLYVGLGAKLPWSLMNVPRFVKHSPFHLIFQDLTGGKLPAMTEDNVFYQLIDYDVA
ncbi:MAG: GNAT family N-acetyltransferase [Prevotella sp.]|nr:GNAT family N-acetyltransferase [Prevotella sp.]